MVYQLKYLLFLLLLALSVSMSGVAMAQEDSAAEQPVAESEAAGDQNAEITRKLELSRQIHEHIPVSEKVNNAIDAVSMQMQQSEQEAFRSAMRNVLNFRVIEKISIDTMAETFTIEELEFMLEYNENPMSRDIEDKYRIYESQVSPEITRMLDKAMMRVRTGGTLEQ